MEKFNTNLGRSGCHTINIGELLTQIDVQFYSSEEDKIKVPVEKVPMFLGLVWSKLKETFQECEGKEIIIDFGSSPSADAIEGLLKFLLELLPNGQIVTKTA